MVFKVGDFVYSDPGSIGILTDIPDSGRTGGYRINHCQGKDLESGPRGGNSPVFKEGYPKTIGEPADVLFVAAMKHKFKIAELESLLSVAKRDFSALKLSRQIILKKEN